MRVSKPTVPLLFDVSMYSIVSAWPARPDQSLLRSMSPSPQFERSIFFRCTSSNAKTFAKTRISGCAAKRRIGIHFSFSFCSHIPSSATSLEPMGLPDMEMLWQWLNCVLSSINKGRIISELILRMAVWSIDPLPVCGLIGRCRPAVFVKSM